MTLLDKRRNKDMYDLYSEYKNTLKQCKSARNKRQKINKEIRDKYNEPFSRKDHIENTNDIAHLNSMIRDLEEDMKDMEMYLDFEDRFYLHKEYNNTKSMILNQNSYEGEIPLDSLFGEATPDTTDIICDIELQEEIVELLKEVLTERQRQVIEMYYWGEMTQEQIARELDLDRTTVTHSIQNSLEKLRKSVKIKDFTDI